MADTSPLVVQKIKLARRLPPVMGVGAYLKNALGLIQDDEVWISRENGSLDNVAAIGAFQETAAGLLSAAQKPPVALAHDWHPDFYCTRWAMENGTRVIGVQHHHAHTAAIMAEHGVETPVLGLALDGFGLGAENQSWGGELLRVDAAGFTRVGFLKPMPQPGGDRAAREPWRMGAAALWALGRGGEIATRYAAFQGAGQLSLMMDRGLNAPMTSSAGRLFDAACGLLNVKPVAAFEGEAPMELERLASAEGIDSRIDSNLWRIESADDSLILDMRPLLQALAHSPAETGAALFHACFAAALINWVKKASQQTGIKTICLSGGCFFNKLLLAAMLEGLPQEGLTPLAPVRMMAGDTAIALGQAYAAALQIDQEG